MVTGITLSVSTAPAVALPLPVAWVHVERCEWFIMMKRERTRFTGLGTEWRYTSDSGQQFEVAVLVPRAGKQVDPSLVGWMAQVEGRQVFPVHGASWSSENDALDGVETWIGDRNP
jgi:hypothetical protein